jgi:sugar/nucleoside kinase (ribokinase family)
MIYLFSPSNSYSTITSWHADCKQRVVYINEGQLKFNNTSKTFINANGKECSEIDYFLHNLSTSSNKEVLDSITSNTSDHPIRMEFKFDYKAYEKGSPYL